MKDAHVSYVSSCSELPYEKFMILAVLGQRIREEMEREGHIGDMRRFCGGGTCCARTGESTGRIQSSPRHMPSEECAMPTTHPSHSSRRSIPTCLSNSFSHPRAVSQCLSFAGSASMGSRTRLPCPPRVAISSVLNAQHITLRIPAHYAQSAAGLKPSTS